MRYAVLVTKIGSLYFWVVHYLLRGAFGNFFSGVEDDDAFRKLHYCPHDVLDHDDRNPLLVQPEQDGQNIVDLRAGDLSLR